MVADEILYKMATLEHFGEDKDGWVIYFKQFQLTFYLHNQIVIKKRIRILDTEIIEINGLNPIDVL
jgi:hypothetical protein